MNVIDRFVGFFSPASGLRRAAARITLDQVRNYDGAVYGRRTAGWRSNNASANVAIKRDLPTLRSRSRDLVRNTWWGQRIHTVFTAHAVGSGIMPKPNTGNKRLDRRVKAAFKKWAATCDYEGQLNFDGLVALATNCIVESGEVLGHLRSVSPSSVKPGVVPLQLQLLEPDHLDASHDLMMTSTKMVDQGIEYDDRGRRVAYWVWPVHPGARGLVMPKMSVRVEADNMLHCYRKVRIGQGRGVPWLAPVMLKGRDLADLEEAVIVKARIEACLAAFIKSNNPARTLADQVSNEPVGSSKRRIETMAPGMVAYLDQGEELQTVNPSSSTQFEAVLTTQWLALAAGAGVTYDQLTGDLRRANYSSLKAGKIEFRRIVEQFQHLTLVAMFLDPLWQRWCADAMDAGILPRRAEGYPVEWIMPANEPVDPMKDMQADILAVRSGRMTWPQFVAAWGLDPDTQLDEIEAWYADIDARGIILDTDPRLALISTKGAAKDEANTEVNNAPPKPQPKPK
ncbi:phage portal protein [Bradyrhizobium sp. SZCCHNR3003]|uniref:phage portal protein n=1 Tax=Bradyrhizobium sp. SZCCHNR3003 TaxID=3057387 RepID=UPI002916C3D8|nr:phage portal protein [Bradyrhizobium sp. SZCCHNR3003]